MFTNILASMIYYCYLLYNNKIIYMIITLLTDKQLCVIKS